MDGSTFDTLTYAKKLQAAGVTPQQAGAQPDVLRAVVDENLATKRDLKALEVALRQEMALLRRDIIIWLGGIFIVSVTTLGVLIKAL